MLSLASYFIALLSQKVSRQAQLVFTVSAPPTSVTRVLSYQPCTHTAPQFTVVSGTCRAEVESFTITAHIVEKKPKTHNDSTISIIPS